MELNFLRRASSTGSRKVRRLLIMKRPWRISLTTVITVPPIRKSTSRDEGSVTDSESRARIRSRRSRRARSPAGAGGKAQLPEPVGIFPEQAIAFVVAAAGKDGVGRRHPGEQPAAERADRPVAAPDDAVPAETVDDVLHIGTQRLGGPGAAVRIGDDAGNLGDHVRPGREIGDAALPSVEIAALDIGHAAMVEDEGDALARD